MFPSQRTSALARRALGALRLTRSFLLLEDDHEVDWEVDWSEPWAEHPHRVPLRGRMATRLHARRRPGRPTPPAHVCISPVARRCPPPQMSVDNTAPASAGCNSGARPRSSPLLPER